MSKSTWTERHGCSGFEPRSWLENGRKASYLWSHERVREAAAALAVGPAVDLSEDEQEFLVPIDPAAMLAELERPETSHERRALIGERLDVAGLGPSTRLKGPLDATRAASPAVGKPCLRGDGGPGASRGERVPAQETGASQCRTISISSGATPLDLARTLMVCVILFEGELGYGVVPTHEFDGDLATILLEYDPFG
jgi:hypothetical protein